MAFGVDPDHGAWIAMEFVSRLSLRQVLRRREHERLELAEALTVLRRRVPGAAGPAPRGSCTATSSRTTCS
ncbi:MAG: hypothetical protein R3F62_07855 [Planctomycetota bacterium]